MIPSKNCFDKIKTFEGCVLHAYPDPASGGDPWTIGYGSTYYEDGTPVKKGDEISKERAEALLHRDGMRRAGTIGSLVHSSINQNQFDALVSFAYNVGLRNFKTSTLLKKVNANPNDPTIRNEFAKWILAAGHVLNNLIERREQEAHLYFTPVS
jgi:lysozyme